MFLQSKCLCGGSIIYIEPWITRITWIGRRSAEHLGASGRKDQRMIGAMSVKEITLQTGQRVKHFSLTPNA